MTDQELIGIHEVASLAQVSPSAVANWRKRFPDFPLPVVELKSGPVFRLGTVQAWLAKRQGKELRDSFLFYDQLASKRGDDPELMERVEETVKRLTDETTSVR